MPFDPSSAQRASRHQRTECEMPCHACHVPSACRLWRPNHRYQPEVATVCDACDSVCKAPPFMQTYVHQMTCGADVVKILDCNTWCVKSTWRSSSSAAAAASCSRMCAMFCLASCSAAASPSLPQWTSESSAAAAGCPGPADATGGRLAAWPAAGASAPAEPAAVSAAALAAAVAVSAAAARASAASLAQAATLAALSAAANAR